MSINEFMYQKNKIYKSFCINEYGIKDLSQYTFVEIKEILVWMCQQLLN